VLGFGFGSSGWCAVLAAVDSLWEAMYSFPEAASHSASARVLGSGSAATPVSIHFSLARSKRKMWKSLLAGSNIDPHQPRSLNHSLLSGLELVSSAAIGPLAGPRNPMSLPLAEANAAVNAVASAHISAAITALRTGNDPTERTVDSAPRIVAPHPGSPAWPNV
jgi:hypothetical protein